MFHVPNMCRDNTKRKFEWYFQRRYDGAAFNKKVCWSADTLKARPVQIATYTSMHHDRPKLYQAYRALTSKKNHKHNSFAHIEAMHRRVNDIPAQTSLYILNINMLVQIKTEMWSLRNLNLLHANNQEHWTSAVTVNPTGIQHTSSRHKATAAWAKNTKPQQSHVIGGALKGKNAIN